MPGTGQGRRFVIAAAAAVVVASFARVGAQPATPGPRFEVAFSRQARSEPVTGRVYIAISRTNDRQTPLQQTSATGAPLFSHGVEGLAPGQVATIDARDPGHPVASL